MVDIQLLHPLKSSSDTDEQTTLLNRVRSRGGAVADVGGNVGSPDVFWSRTHSAIGPQEDGVAGDVDRWANGTVCGDLFDDIRARLVAIYLHRCLFLVNIPSLSGCFSDHPTPSWLRVSCFRSREHSACFGVTV